MTDHDKLVSGLQQMKSSRANLALEPVLTDFAIDPVNIPPDHLTLR